MSELPEGWEETELGDVAQVIRGVTYTKIDATSLPGSGRLPILRATNINGKLSLDSEMVYVPQRYVREDQRVREGDVIVATSSGSASVVGKSAQLRQPWTGGFGAFCSLIRADAELDSRYIAHFVASPRVRKLWRGLAQGTNINNLKTADLATTCVPLAPRSEQERIVAAIEEQFSRLDAGVAALERARQNLDSLVRSIILAAIPPALPEGWSMVKVRDAGEARLGRQRSPQFHHGPNMRPYLRVANVFEDRIDTGDVMQMHFSDEDFERYLLHPGDVLLNEGQSPHLLGRPAIYRGDPPNVAFTNTLIRFRPRADILPEWALLVFRRHMHARRFMRESRITTNIAHLSVSRLNTVEFPIPPLDEQRRIISEVDRQLSDVKHLEGQLSQQLAWSTALRTSILSTAFSGMLVPQDPNDEPASMLLERIAAERAASNDRKPTHKPRQQLLLI